jgi:hypothetical protein
MKKYQSFGDFEKPDEKKDIPFPNLTDINVSWNNTVPR